MRERISIAFIAMALLCATAGIATAATVTQDITYQGVLTDSSGNPLTGTYPVIFSLYDVASGGTPFTSYIESVQCTNGQFTATLPIFSGFCDGRALWLAIRVGSDPVMTPRQEIRPVPYALSLRPGAKISTTGAGTSGNPLPGINISTPYDWNPGILIRTSGIFSDGVYARTYGELSNAFSAITTGEHAACLYATATGNDSAGVWIYTDGYNSPGVWVQTQSDWSDAVHAVSWQSFGVYGSGGEGGGFFTTGKAGTVTAPVSGVKVYTQFRWNPGMRINTTADSSYGAWVTTGGAYSPGIYTITGGANSDGVQAYAYGPSSSGIRSSSTNYYGLYAETARPDNEYGVYTPDKMSALAYDTNFGDVAEYLPVSEEVSPGTVLVIGKDGVLQPCIIEYDTHVAGIVSAAPGIALGKEVTGNKGEALIAVAGKVPCKVDASNEPIYPGDLLTTSNKPGYAMKAEPVNMDGIEIYKPGTIIGKAMGTLETGMGTIEVLVTLQ